MSSDERRSAIGGNLKVKGQDGKAAYHAGVVAEVVSTNPREREEAPKKIMWKSYGLGEGERIREKLMN